MPLITVSGPGSRLYSSDGGGGGAPGFVAEEGFTVSAPDGFVDGAQITVTDSQERFGTKPGTTAGPLYCFDFGRSGSMSLHSASRATSASFDDTVIQSSDVASNRDYAAIYTHDGDASAVAGPWDTEQDGQTAHFWAACRWKTLWDGTDAYAEMPGIWNVKGWRYWGASGTDVNYALFRAYGQQDSAGGAPRFNTGGVSGSSGAGNLGSIHGLPYAGFQYEEYRLKHDSSANTNTADLYTATKGIEVGHSANPIKERDASEERYHRLYLHQYEDMPAGFQHLYDFIMVEDSWCRIIVADRSTWSDSVEHEREPQIPLEWSAGQLKFEFRRGVFGSSLESSCLFVVTDANTKLKIGAFT